VEKIGLIAGNGTFPVAFAREAKARGYGVVAVAHLGESRPEIAGVADSVEWIRVGQIGRMIRTFVHAGIRRAVMAGGIDKARSLTRVWPDRRGLKLLGRMLTKGDDALLRGLAAELESEGIEIVACTTFLDRLLFPVGVFAGAPPNDRVERDLRLGVSVLRALGPLDVGQSVVVEDGVVLAVEAIEGTDATIRRAAVLGRGHAVVVKGAKRGQDMRFDVPAVGPETIDAMASAGAKTLAVEAGAAIVLDGEEFARRAKRAGIDVVGWDGSGEVRRG
jgi:DUF1009 family protein